MYLINHKSHASRIDDISCTIMYSVLFVVPDNLYHVIFYCFFTYNIFLFRNQNLNIQKMNKAIPCSSLSLDKSIQNHHPYQSYPFSFVDQNPQVTIDCKVRLHLKSAWPFAYLISRGTD